MTSYQLFRLRLFLKPNLFNEDVDRIKILRDIISAKPSAELREGFWWHIGNVQKIDENSAYFAIGRTTKSIVELYDPDTKDFIINEHPESPYTYAYVDFSLQLLAIGNKAKLAQSPKIIAGYFEKLLNKQEEIRQTDMTASIAELNDPRDFITHLKEAVIVSRFTAKFTLPNLFDSEEDFEKPFQRYLNESEGNKGSASVSGADLNRDIIEKISRSCAASGNDATARMKDSDNSSFKTRHLQGRSVFVDYDDEDPKVTAGSFIDAIRRIYNSIRAEQD